MLQLFVEGGKHKLENIVDNREVYVITSRSAYWFRDEFETESRIYSVKPRRLDSRIYLYIQRKLFNYRFKSFLNRTGDNK